MRTAFLVSVLISVLLSLALVAAVLYCLSLLHRWQNRLLRRERGEEPPGFPVQFPSTPQAAVDEADGWDGSSDDLCVNLPAGQAVGELVDFVISNALDGVSDDENERLLVNRFGLSENDAALVRDRTFGGIVRSVLGSDENRPSEKRDPIAWASFQRARKDRSIAARIYPGRPRQ